MAYEKKIEPLKKYEILFAGLSLQLWLILSNALPWMAWSNECIDIVLKSDVSNEDEMESFHTCISDHRDGMLLGCTLVLLAYPLIMAHIYYVNRAIDTMLAFLDMGLTRWLYTASFGIAATIFCTLLPALGIFVAYYDWDFGDDDKYAGYAMQFQFFNFLIILHDSCDVPLGIASICPWVWIIGILLGKFRSTHYTLSQEVKQKMIGSFTQCPNCATWFVVLVAFVFILIVLFGTLGDVFDFAENGFFSYHGDSQYLAVILFLTWQVECLMLFGGAYRYDATADILNKNVKGMSEQDSLGL